MNKQSDFFEKKSESHREPIARRYHQLSYHHNLNLLRMSYLPNRVQLCERIPLNKRQIENYIVKIKIDNNRKTTSRLKHVHQINKPAGLA